MTRCSHRAPAWADAASPYLSGGKDSEITGRHRASDAGRGPARPGMTQGGRPGLSAELGQGAAWLQARARGTGTTEPGGTGAAGPPGVWGEVRSLLTCVGVQQPRLPPGLTPSMFVNRL